jgi:hypothetical protein
MDYGPVVFPSHIGKVFHVKIVCLVLVVFGYIFSAYILLYFIVSYIFTQRGSFVYCCFSQHNDRKAFCPTCRKPITNELRYIEYVDPVSKDIKASSSSEGGYVKGGITYMVMDDLDVKPMSIVSAIILLTKFNVTDVGAVEEKVVELGMDEVYIAIIPFLFSVHYNSTFE